MSMTEADLLKNILAAMGQAEQAQTRAQGAIADQGQVIKEQQQVLRETSADIADTISQQGEVAAQKLLLDVQLRNQLAEKTSANVSKLEETVAADVHTLASLNKDRATEQYNVDNPGFFTKLGTILGLIDPNERLNEIDTSIARVGQNIARTQSVINNEQSLANSAIKEVTNEQVGLGLAELALKNKEKLEGQKIEQITPELQMGQAKVSLAGQEAQSFAAQAEGEMKKLSLLYMTEDQRFQRQAFANQQQESKLRMAALLREKDKFDQAAKEDAYLAGQISKTAKLLGLTPEAVTLLAKSNADTPQAKMVKNLIVGGTASMPFTEINEVYKTGGFNGAPEEVKQFANILGRASSKAELELAAMGVNAPKSAEARNAAIERFTQKNLVEELYHPDSGFGRVFVPQLLAQSQFGKSKKGINPLDSIGAVAPQGTTPQQLIASLSNDPKFANLNIASQASFISDYFTRYRFSIPSAPGVADKFNLGTHKVIFNVKHPTDATRLYNLVDPVQAQQYLVAETRNKVFSN